MKTSKLCLKLGSIRVSEVCSDHYQVEDIDGISVCQVVLRTVRIEEGSNRAKIEYFDDAAVV